MAKKKRKGISARRRFEIFKRDSFTCQYCGRRPPQVILEADHVVPVSDGGIDDDGNLATSCQDCNRGKSNVSLDSVPQALDQQMQDRQDRAAQLEEYNEFLLRQRNKDDEDLDMLGRRWNELVMGKDGRKYVFGDARIASVRRFLKDLPVVEVIDAMEIALSRKCASWSSDYAAWKYFCGVCWSKIRELES